MNFIFIKVGLYFTFYRFKFIYYNFHNKKIDFNIQHCRWYVNAAADLIFIALQCIRDFFISREIISVGATDQRKNFCRVVVIVNLTSRFWWVNKRFGGTRICTARVIACT